MRAVIGGLAALLAVCAAGPAMAVDMTEEIQEEEQPGSEIEIDMGEGGAQIERKSGRPLLDIGGGGGEKLNAPNDPDMPEAGDPIDDALPGEGPQDLSGPDDDDNLPD
jgi:hypothetical protein